MKILIVDDSPTVRNFLKTILKKDDRFEIVGEAKNGDEAIEMVKTTSPDLVTLDITMPVKNGIDAAEEIRKISRGVKILFLTSMKDKEVENTAKRLGIEYILQKPISIPDLNEILDKISKEG